MCDDLNKQSESRFPHEMCRIYKVGNWTVTDKKVLKGAFTIKENIKMLEMNLASEDTCTVKDTHEL